MTDPLLPTTTLSDDASPVDSAPFLRASQRQTLTETVERMVADIRELTPAITVRIAEMEATRGVPPDLIDTLKSIGIFRMMVPRSHCGLELDLPALLQILAALGKVDGSIAWIAMITSALATRMPLFSREVYDEIYRDGPDLIFAGSIVPAGSAEAAEEGWHVTGRWPFASGCRHADFLCANCVMLGDGRPLPGQAPGVPLIQGFFLAARQWQIEDTWHAAGLRGTGSHHIALDRKWIPETHFHLITDGVQCVPGALYQCVMLEHILPLIHGAVALGIAEGGLDDIVALANTGRKQLHAQESMRDSETLQNELGRVAAELMAARACLEVQAARHWGHALAGTLADDPLLVQQANQAGIWVTTTCIRAADACFALGGSSSLYESSPLQRRLRDLHVAGQHFQVQQRRYREAGRLLLENSYKPEG